MSRSLSHDGSSGPPKCVVDRSILNEGTIGDVADIGVSFFATLCGKNRGAFVLDPPDGNTYGCTNFPSKFAELAGVDTDVALKDSNAIKEQFVAGNITASDAVDLLDYFTRVVYHATANKKELPYGCDVGGLAELKCGDSQKPSLLKDGSPVRSATLAGVFVPAPWATKGKKLTLDEAKAWYTDADFSEMKGLVGLNTVQIPVFTSSFESGGESVKEAVGDVLSLVDGRGLGAILVLVKDDDTVDVKDAVISASKFASNERAVIAITLPSLDSSLVAAARTVVSTLPLLVPANLGDLRHLKAEDNLYAALEMPHTNTIGDIASSTSVDDRMKLFYHEATSCISRSPVEYAHCYRHVPALISSGFDLSIDDCINKGTELFRDYGQCDRLNETIDSDWWYRHRRSFASRQVFAYERGLGWSFAAWKLYEEDEFLKDVVGVLDSPAKLLSLRDVYYADLMPELQFTKETPAALACLNPPEADFLLGDNTLAPTAGPPPDCGNGWWNYTTAQCDYWVPPPEPVLPPCNATLMTEIASTSNAALGIAALAGAAAVAIVGAVVLKLKGRNAGYQSLP